MVSQQDDVHAGRADSPPVEVLAVIPSIGGAGVASVLKLQRYLGQIDSFECVVVSNSLTLTKELELSECFFVTNHRNGGFGASIKLGASALDKWSWLLIVNDDIVLDPERFAETATDFLRADELRADIVYFDEDQQRTIPGAFEVFMQVSLLSNVIRRIPLRRTVTGHTYRSFSCVAISRRLWEQSGGFDPDLPFTYEDADFVRRSIELDAVQICALESGVTHSHSVSSGRYVDRVLPVATYSAAMYLDKKNGRPRSNSLLLETALLIRVLLVPLAKSSRLKHLRGIRRAMSAVWQRQHSFPELPDYQRL
jgi:GT2 family glycosyltransferase